MYNFYGNKNKYKNTKIKVDGINFDSKKEAVSYQQLKLMEESGVIKNLELQPVFILQDKFIHNGKTVRAITYKADFKYFDNKKNIEIIEDVKSDITKKDKVYRLKKKMMLKKGYIINEV